MPRKMRWPGSGHYPVGDSNLSAELSELEETATSNRASHLNDQSFFTEAAKPDIPSSLGGRSWFDDRPEHGRLKCAQLLRSGHLHDRRLYYCLVFAIPDRPMDALFDDDLKDEAMIEEVEEVTETTELLRQQRRRSSIAIPV